MSISIKTRNSSKEELFVKNILEEVISTYKPPSFTEEIIIEQGVIPHSHPILTLNTRSQNKLTILKTYVHEQFHWYAQNNSNYKKNIEFLKKYDDLGDCNKSGTHPNSFWEHLIVCWNTYHYLAENLNEEELESVYESWQAYPLTEKFVRDNYKELMGDLLEIEMIY